MLSIITYSKSTEYFQIFHTSGELSVIVDCSALQSNLDPCIANTGV